MTLPVQVRHQDGFYESLFEMGIPAGFLDLQGSCHLDAERLAAEFLRRGGNPSLEAVAAALVERWSSLCREGGAPPSVGAGQLGAAAIRAGLDEGWLVAAYNFFADHAIRSLIERRPSDPALLARQISAIHGRVARDTALAIEALQAAAGCSTDDLDGLTGDLRSTMMAVATETEKANEEASQAAGSADMVVMNVRMVSAMVAQISTGIHDAVTNSDRSRNVAEEALKGVETTAGRVATLAEIGNRIENVVKLIRTIAHQTNMLALNATIEAARAGDAGRGFAVVATEVKHLAKETARATEEISTQIRHIREATAQVAASMATAQTKVREVHDLAGHVADAVHEQDDMTRTVQTYIEEAATSVEEIGLTVGRIVEQVTATGDKTHTILSRLEEICT
ncbi:MAG TPA: methyl-accepting chemotaxis protein [Azospirillaceae bacterium]|nr:methyl-accepting chemotaxis protein [Azospirillaceae bacterium]